MEEVEVGILAEGERERRRGRGSYMFDKINVRLLKNFKKKTFF